MPTTKGTNNMKFKIQIASVGGWADLKESDGQGSYEDCLFNTQDEAQAEIDSFPKDTEGDSKDDWRIVPSTTEADDDLYN
jgi:hypothetical protein